MSQGKEGRFRFYRAGGVDQVQITTGRDLVALKNLDQKLWVALSCPVKGLEFDERTLALIDADKDGRVQAPELLGAIGWTAEHLKDVEELATSSPSLPLSVIDDSTDDGRILRETAASVLKALGKPEADAIDVEDTKTALEAFNKEAENGDGILPPSRIVDADLQAVATKILGQVKEPRLDRSGETGLDRADVVTFFEAVRARLEWLAAGKADELLLRGSDTEKAFSSLQAVRAKIEDFFARARVAAFDERALANLNRDEAAFQPLGEAALDRAASQLESFPIARVAAQAVLPLTKGINPAWAARLQAFRDDVVTPTLGEREQLDEASFHSLVDRFAPYLAWFEKKPPAALEGFDAEELRAWTESGVETALLALIAADEAAKARHDAIESVEKLVRFRRDLLKLANNFVSFRDFYRPGAQAIFQVGTLYIDQRSADFCVQVNDSARQATLAPLSRMYLLFCDLKNGSGKTMQIVSAITNGDVDNLMVGRNGLFYDRSGTDWDATVTRIVDNPISIRQAFWSPYKKLVRLVEEQVNKRAAAAQAESDANVAANATVVDGVTQGTVKPVAPPPKKIDIGIVAALGVAVGGITAALGVVMQAFFGLGIWMPLGVIGLLLLISGPSMAVAWLKLRQRNIGPILDANGWAVNVLPRVNVPLGRSLTQVAALPKGSSRNLVDPFAEKKKPWWLLILIAILAVAGALWFVGKLDAHLPEDVRSTTVLGEAAPAHVKVAPEPAAAAPAAPAKP